MSFGWTLDVFQRRLTKRAGPAFGWLIQSDISTIMSTETEPEGNQDTLYRLMWRRNRNMFLQVVGLQHLFLPDDHTILVGGTSTTLTNKQTNKQTNKH
jgi:hypothetical protein